jgi:hypothetical protein
MRPAAACAAALFFVTGCRGCGERAAPIPAPGVSAIVQDFEGGPAIKKWPRDAPGAAEVGTEWHADGQRSLKIDSEVMASLSDLQVRDFSGFTTLVFQVHNPTAETARIELEIQDDHTALYDRHQHSFGVAPGDQRIDLDFSGGLWRGEESRPYRGSVKTPIDVSRITRLAFTNRGHAAIYIDRIALEVAPKIEAKGACAFDFGPTGSQVMGQSIGVFETTRYTSERGHGFLEDTIARVQPSMSYPTPLLGDGLGWPDAGFRVDLDGGDYLGWIAFERGGFWEGESSGYRRAALAVNGAVVCSHDFTASGPHFFFEDTELTDPTQIEDRILRPAAAIQRFSWKAQRGGNTFTLTVLDSRGSPLRVAGLLLAPDTPSGRAFLEAHDALQSKAIRAAFPPADRGRRSAPRAAPQQDLVAEPLTPGAQVYPRDFPLHPRGAPLSEILAISGQPVTLHFAVYATREQKVHAEASLSGAPSAQRPAPRISVGRYLPMLSAAPGPVWIEVNHYRPAPDFTVGPELTRSLLIEFPMPDRGSGVFTGAITLSGEATKLSIPLRIRLIDRPLPEIPIPVGLFMNALPFGPSAVGEATWWRYQEDLLREQARAGLNCLTGGSDIEHPLGSPVGAPDPAAEYLALARRIGPVRAVVPYGGFLPPLKALPLAPRDLAEALSAFGAPHYAYAYDEPGTEVEIQQALELVSPFTAAGVKTMGFTSIQRDAPGLDALLRNTYAPALSIHDAGDLSRRKAQGRHVWVYNNGLHRYGMGLHLWRSLKLGAEGRLEWIGMITQGFAFNNLDGREPSPSAWVVHEALGPLPTPRWLAAREGLLDLRIRLALEAAVPADDPALQSFSLEGYRADQDRFPDEILAAIRAAMLERLGRAPL